MTGAPHRRACCGRGIFCRLNRRTSMPEMAKLLSSPYPFPEERVFEEKFAVELVDYLVGDKAFERL